MATPPERRSLDGWLAGPRQGVRLLCALSDAEICRLLAHERVAEWEIACLPLASNRSAQASFGVPDNLAAAVKGACSIEKATPIDLLVCNGRVVLGTIITGDVWGLHSDRMEEQFWRRLGQTLSRLGSLRLQPYTLATAKGNAQDLAAMGVMVFGHHFAGSTATAIREPVTPNDGKLTAFVLSPTSVTGHLWFLLKFRLLRRLALKDLPLFPRAAEGDFRELFRGLRESARTSTAFVVLMLLSTLLAATGLFLNSASVIIGAMILAPLMAPLISLAMGIVRTDARLIRTSLKTLFSGLTLGVGCAALFALMTPLQTITPEMDGRLHPSLLDLLVALLSGAAGAYANSKEQLAQSMAGVAIAVALVPPLAVLGIGIGWGNPDMIVGSGLLFLTNLIGITLAASLTFLVLGFAPVSRARNALAMSLGLLALIAIPLALSFQTMIRQNAIRVAIDEIAQQNPADGVLEVREVSIRGERAIVRIDIRTRGRLSEAVIARQKARIAERLGQDIDVEFSPVYVR